MKKRILIATLASLLSVNVYANTYVGAALGLQDIRQSTSKFRGWRPGVFFGYGDMIHGDTLTYYLAGELAASWVSTISDTYVSRVESLRMAPEISVSLIPGTILKPDLLGYLRFGVAEAKQIEPNRWLEALILGAGLEYEMTPCWSIRGELDYSFFSNTNVGNPASWDGILSLKYTYDV